MTQTTAGPVKQQVQLSANFRLDLPKMSIKGLTSVSGLSMELEVVEATEINEKGHSITTKRPATVNYGEITLKRYVIGEKQFYNWINDIRNGKDDFRADGSIILLKQDLKSEQSRWNFTNAWPSKWSLSDLDSKSSENMTEELTLQIELLQRVK